MMDIRDGAAPSFPLPPEQGPLCWFHFPRSSLWPGNVGKLTYSLGLFLSSSRRGPSSGSTYCATQLSGGTGLNVGPSKIPLVKELPSCPSPQGTHLIDTSDFPGQAYNNSLLCPIVPAFSSKEFTTPYHLSGQGDWTLDLR